MAALVRRERASGVGEKTQLGSLGEAGVIPSPSPIFLHSKIMGLDKVNVRLLKAPRCHHVGLSKAAHFGICTFFSPHQNPPPFISDSRVFLP